MITEMHRRDAATACIRLHRVSFVCAEFERDFKNKINTRKFGIATLSICMAALG
jgi:hypothetical protein